MMIQINKIVSALSDDGFFAVPLIFLSPLKVDAIYPMLGQYSGINCLHNKLLVRLNRRSISTP
jgi:hypothetical protein